MVQKLLALIFTEVFMFYFAHYLLIEGNNDVCLLRKLADPQCLVQLEEIVLVLQTRVSCRLFKGIFALCGIK